MEKSPPSFPAPETDPAAAAFAHLADKVDALEAAIANLASRREAAPDYSETLGMIAHNLNAVGAMVKTMRQSPALQITPDERVARIATAGDQARAEERATIARARETLDRATEKLESLAAAVATTDEQRLRLLFAAIAGAIAGVVLWSFLLDAIARALPPDWRIPESMATHTLGASSPWEAGSQLMRTANPRAWAALNEASDFLRDNHETIEKCREAATQTGKPIRCDLGVKPPLK
ncbi:hypothetical protein IYY11_06110 [Methylocystis sp. H62]|uniref:DUF6118 family protein n=1 Tax=Methylocystis sp. H62 TaxID=2785789 RepID=UPI0018C34A02|nr:DUF6118 family protein [Methylocystis sp. H62]MBG0792963.1 hypothetical protein [Methylocystis sp. H62]